MDNYIYIMNLTSELEAHTAAEKLEQASLEYDIRKANKQIEKEMKKNGYYTKGYDIYVPKEVYNEAKELLKEYAQEQLEKYEEDNNKPWYNNPHKLAWFIIGWGAVIMAISLQIALLKR